MPSQELLTNSIEMGGKDVPPYPVILESLGRIVFQPNNIKIKTKENHFIEHECKLTL